jgi:hypothetical protein
MITPSSERGVNNDDYGKTAPRKNKGHDYCKIS